MRKTASNFRRGERSARVVQKTAWLRPSGAIREAVETLPKLLARTHNPSQVAFSLT